MGQDLIISTRVGFFWGLGWWLGCWPGRLDAPWAHLVTGGVAQAGEEGGEFSEDGRLG
jgi:hypothetical protein